MTVYMTFARASMIVSPEASANEKGLAQGPHNIPHPAPVCTHNQYSAWQCRMVRSVSQIAEAICIARRCSPNSVGFPPGALSPFFPLVKKHHSAVVGGTAGTVGHGRLTDSAH